MSAQLQRCLAWPVAALAWLGRQGTRALAALVVFGIACPPLGAVLRPYVTEAVFMLLLISFVRIDLAAMRSYVRRPGLVLAASLWGTVAVPLVVGLGGSASGFAATSPDLFLGLMLQAVASPMMSSPALVALMGLDATLVLIALVTGTLLVPLTAPVFAYFFFSDGLSLSPLSLGLKLFMLMAGALLLAGLIRYLVGGQRIARHTATIDGFNILVLLVFVSAVMGTVAGSFLADPIGVLLLIAFAFLVFGAILAVTFFAFRGFGTELALAVALMSCQRNMGLMMGGAEGAVPDLTWLYFALAQFPIYLSPQLLMPLVRRLQTRPVPAA
jgi:BASS family bile acid:Na+ symporter